LSRKRFIGEALQGALQDQRAVGSVTGHLLSIQQGASIVRAHDVKEMHDAILVWKAIQQMPKYDDYKIGLAQCSLN
jgi:dihydropteroate synthase